MRTIHVVMFSGLVLLAATSVAAPTPKAEPEVIRSHLTFLADDLLEGRETGTRGFDLAAKYVGAQFQQNKLVPKGEKASFFQQVPLRMTTMTPGSAVVEMQSSTGVERFSEFTDYYVHVEEGGDRSSAATPLVFVGFGISSKRHGHDDYSGKDLKGKVAVVLEGYPSRFPSEEGAHFGDFQIKREAAAKAGAVGLVILWTSTSDKKIPFTKARRYFTTPRMKWIDDVQPQSSHLAGMQDTVMLSMPAARRLFKHTGVNLDEIYAAAAANQPLPYADLKVAMRLSRTTTSNDLSSSNVVGMIEGSDARLKNEYVVFSAHLDGIGRIKEKSGDNIYNGAMDNASGVAILIETARMFSRSTTRPKRSILFVALTAEEKGLLGSGFFARHPTVPVGSIVANINIDMPLLTYDFKNVIAFGAEHSSLGASVGRAISKMGLSAIPDPWPEMGMFTRSDHYNFVREGVPSIFLSTGTSSFNVDEDGTKLWEKFRQTHYHQPSDDLHLPFNFDAAARLTQVNFMIALEIANAKEKPTWNKDDFFGDTFKK